ncbi:hypothetical protein [Siminovitchia sp. 179-K 8D1 HS]
MTGFGEITPARAMGAASFDRFRQNNACAGNGIGLPRQFIMNTDRLE